MLMSVKVTDEEIWRSGNVRRGGFVLFSRSRADGTMYVLMVKKVKGALPWGFPKGGIEGDETVLETAFRELREETGVAREQVVLVDQCARTFAEPNELGKFTIYYCATFSGDPGQQKFAFSGDEIEEVRWVDVDSVVEFQTMMKPTRLAVLEMALEYYYSLSKS